MESSLPTNYGSLFIPKKLLLCKSNFDHLDLELHIRYIYSILNISLGVGTWERLGQDMCDCFLPLRYVVLTYTFHISVYKLLYYVLSSFRLCMHEFFHLFMLSHGWCFLYTSTNRSAGPRKSWLSHF